MLSTVKFVWFVSYYCDQKKETYHWTKAVSYLQHCNLQIKLSAMGQKCDLAPYFLSSILKKKDIILNAEVQWGFITTKRKKNGAIVIQRQDIYFVRSLKSAMHQLIVIYCNKIKRIIMKHGVLIFTASKDVFIILNNNIICHIKNYVRKMQKWILNGSVWYRYWKKQGTVFCNFSWGLQHKKTFLMQMKCSVLWPAYVQNLWSHRWKLSLE